jgi:hypothetical protein
MERKTLLSRKPGTGENRTPPDRERGPYAGSEALRRFFGSAQPTEERGSAPGRGNPARANAHKTLSEVELSPFRRQLNKR